MRALLLLVSILLLQLSVTAQPSVLTLMPRPATAWVRPDGFRITPTTTIVVPDTRDAAMDSSIAWLQSRIEKLMGSQLELAVASEFRGGSAVFVGRFGAEPIASREQLFLPAGETCTRPGGYVLDISSQHIVLAGFDVEGVFNGTATLVQLAIPNDGAINVVGSHVWDYPDYSVRWVFGMQNLRGPGQLVGLRRILDTMSVLKLNGIQQNDFKYALLGSQPDYYFDSVAVFREYARARGIGIYPGVMPIGYSEGILWHDPNLAEGVQAVSRLVIQGDTGRLVPNPRATLVNSGFEGIDAGGRFTGWNFYDAESISPDSTVARSGRVSARMSNFRSVNARFSRRLECRPNTCYRLSAWVRTEGLSADMLQLLALGIDAQGTYRPLTFTNFSIPVTTNGWRQIQVVFNTLSDSAIQVYCGLWGTRGGVLWVDDFTIEEVALVNILRRSGTPLHVRDARTGREFLENIDFAPVVDSKLGGGGGSYAWHEGPTFRRVPGGNMRNGDTVEISWFHPITTVADEQGYGQNMVCISEDTVYSILTDQIDRLQALYSPDWWLMQHDEIRMLNQDSACLRRGLSPAQLLGDNTTRCYRIIDSISPGSEVGIWSDMYDSLHNAVNGYYLVNGDLRGIWNMIPRELVIGNWAGFAMSASLAKFSQLGFRQFTAPYYDERGTTNIRAWRLASEGIEGVLGMMYTTWVGDYDFLRPFAYYSWGAGPYIVFRPIDSATYFGGGPDSVDVAVEAVVLADPFDPSDSITSVVLDGYGASGGMPVRLDVPLQRIDGNRWTVRIPRGSSMAYLMRATNRQGLTRETPRYVLWNRAGGVVEVGAGVLALSVAPNPVAERTTVSFGLEREGAWRLRVVDGLGRIVIEKDGYSSGGEHRVELGTEDLNGGVYGCQVVTGTRRRSTVMIVAR